MCRVAGFKSQLINCRLEDVTLETVFANCTISSPIGDIPGGINESVSHNLVTIVWKESLIKIQQCKLRLVETGIAQRYLTKNSEIEKIRDVQQQLDFVYNTTSQKYCNLSQTNAEAVKFLWITEPETPGSPLMAYKWKRVPFGLSSSPFLLRVTLNKHLDGMEPLYSTTIRQLKEKIYVDDYLGGADNINWRKVNLRSWGFNGIPNPTPSNLILRQSSKSQQDSKSSDQKNVLRISARATRKESHNSSEIRVFGDASEAANEAVAYARLQTKNSDTVIHFLASKTKVAPLPKKKVTLPRLELLSSLLAVRYSSIMAAGSNFVMESSTPKNRLKTTTYLQKMSRKRHTSENSNQDRRRKTNNDLQEGRQPHHKEKIAVLRPVWDARDKLIKVRRRLELELRDRDIEPTILLPAHHPVVKLILQDRHVSLKHAGVKTTLSDLRERFWIIKGRQQTKSIWHACIKCQRRSSNQRSKQKSSKSWVWISQGRFITNTQYCVRNAIKRILQPPWIPRQRMVRLWSLRKPPIEQVTDTFLHGFTNAPWCFKISFCGLRCVRKTQPKCYACLFTCAVTRAVHLELTKTTFVRDFLLAFRRFSARRVSVSIMYSDNAQTFRRSNGRACLENDELEVILIEIESVVNARPLTYVAEGSDDPLPITLNQFLNNRRSNCTPSEKAVNLVAPDATNANILEMDRQRREYVSDTCERFVTDYLLQIDKFHSKVGPGRKIRVGGLLIIDDDNTKCLMWTVGIVKELITSRDGLIRSVMVKTPNGNLINSAIQSLHPLELRKDQPGDVEVPPAPELESEQEELSPLVSVADPIEQEEPWTTGSGEEGVGNIPYSQQTTRTERRTRVPLRFFLMIWGALARGPSS
ncbi:Uncharacterized protein APZ42_030176 [Daphnia magna]|uniref:DUF5641 domain-containing protein n=1 Tax=Daphnia magna TaxID=35525 RepID=A0A164NZS5_9CRUS|nr:Uncharacterized protein APZ42_030176 [Daphnia magna]